jgi:hypothetical protein
MSKEKSFVSGELKSTSAIYRLLVKNQFSDNELANANSSILLKNKPILSALKGKINIKKMLLFDF